MDTNSTHASALIQATRSVTVPDICDVEDAAFHLRTSFATVRRWMRDGTLPGAKLGRRWYVTREALLAHLRQRSMRVVSP